MSSNWTISLNLGGEGRATPTPALSAPPPITFQPVFLQPPQWSQMHGVVNPNRVTAVQCCFHLCRGLMGTRGGDPWCSLLDCGGKIYQREHGSQDGMSVSQPPTLNMKKFLTHVTSSESWKKKLHWLKTLVVSAHLVLWICYIYSILPTQVLYYKVSITLPIFLNILSYHTSLLKTQTLFQFTSTLDILKQRNNTLKYYLNHRELSTWTFAWTFS